MYPINKNSQVKGRVKTEINRNGHGEFVVTQVIDGYTFADEKFTPDLEDFAHSRYETLVSHSRRNLHEVSRDLRPEA